MDCFAQFARLRTYVHDQIKPKSIACTLALFQVAMNDRNFMRSAWPIVIAEVSTVEKWQYFPVPGLFFTESASVDREDRPRTFLLVRLSDVEYFNLNRWKIVWEELWSIVGELLISAASREDDAHFLAQARVNVLW
jgi:hypothetical protein